MLSHKWEDNEPLFQQLVHMAVYNLDKSLTHDKLKRFCKIIRDARFSLPGCILHHLISTALKLYDCLNTLPVPWLAVSRMKLPCITFKLPVSAFLPYWTHSGCVYCADTLVFRMVEIKMQHDLSQMNILCLTHPWLDALLECLEGCAGLCGQ